MSELAARVPSMSIAEPLTPVSITGEVSVLLVRVCVCELVKISRLAEGLAPSFSVTCILPVDESTLISPSMPSKDSVSGARIIPLIKRSFLSDIYILLIINYFCFVNY